MRDVCRSGHGSVATTAIGLERHAKLPLVNSNNNSSRTRNNNTATGLSSVGHGKPVVRDSSVDDDDEDGDDWDFGIRNLVIDLDADVDVRSRTCAESDNRGSAVDTADTAASATAATADNRGHKGEGGVKMSGVEHHSIVDKGLKMKIKRKNVGSKSAEGKSDTNKDHRSQQPSSSSAAWNSGGSNGNSSGDQGSHVGAATPDKQSERLKHVSQANSGVQVDTKSPKGRVLHKRVKDRNTRGSSDHPQGSIMSANGTCDSNIAGGSVSGGSSVPQGGAAAYTEATGCDRIKKEQDAMAVCDPYEFNAKVEDRIGLPVKKVKVEKSEAAEKPTNCSAPGTETHSVAVGTTSVAVATDPDCLGPCEPGTHVMLEGIVWNETENGVLVVNVTWRGKTYMGTLMDSTKHTWAPPRCRLNCESPISDLESRTPKGRGKRGRGMTVNQPVAEVGDRKLRKTRRNNMGGSITPSSPDITNSSSSGGATGKRKGRPSDLELSSVDNGPKSSKRVRCSMRTNANNTRDLSPELIECPEPNCNKKYRHLNGLKYHQTHAHQEVNSPPSEVTPDEPMDTDAKSSSIGSSDQSENLDKDEKVVTAKGRGKSPRKVVTPSGSVKEHVNCASSQSWFDKDAKVAPVSGDKGRDSGFKETVPSIMAGNKSVHTVRSSASSRGPVTCVGPVTLVTQVMSASNHLVSTSGSVVVSANSASQPHPTSATTVITTVPVATTTVASMADAQASKDSGDRLKRCKIERTDKVTIATVMTTKPKSVIATRPLLPAPPVAGIHTTLSAVSVHAPVTHASFAVTSQLKPIQPKPTIMGETTAVNPALTSLKELKDKKSKKKRNKEKSRETSVDLKSDTVRTSDPLLSVIKPVPSPPRKLVGMVTADRTSGGDVRQADLQKQPAVAVDLEDKVDLTNSVNKGSEPCVRAANVQPPSSLSISSPLEVSTDVRERGSNVQSPAYSDISDANDSAPTLENEVEAKSGVAGDDRLCKVSCDQSLDQCVQATYGICQPFYGQPPYLVPAVPQSQDPLHAGSGSRQSTPKPSLVDKDCTRSKVGSPHNSDPSGEERSNGSGHRGDGCRGDVKLTGEQQREKMMQQSQLFSQYHPYLYSGGGGATGYSNYHMPVMSHSPQYKAEQEQHQRRQEASLGQSPHHRTETSSTQVKLEQKVSGSDNDASSRASVRSPAPKTSFATSASPVASLVPNSHVAAPASVSSSPRSQQQQEKAKNRVPEPKRSTSSDSLKKKQNENHQIMKENIELKNQMPLNRAVGVRGQAYEPPASTSGYDAQFLMELQRQDVQRFYMFQQQRMLEQQRYSDLQQAVDAHQDSGAEKCTPKDLSKPKVSPAARDSSGDRTITSRPAVETSHPKDGVPVSRHQNDVRTRENKSASPLNMAKGKDRPVSGGILLSGGGLPPSAAQFYGHPFQYAGQMPFDPARGIYPGMSPYVGYASAPGYVHHAAMRYHVTPMEAADKEAMVLSPSAAGISAEGKALDLLQQHASHYYNAVPGQHKIHELKDAAKPASGKSTPPLSSSKEVERPGSANSATSPKELTGSPLLQRHLHTHHHTHVVGPGYPMYGSFGSTNLVPSPQQTAAAPPAPPSIPYAPK